MLITDHLGSVRLVVKVSDGTVVQRNDYNDLGGVSYTTGASAQPLRYAGGVYDPDSGFMKFGYRDYDPETGRWTSKDPILFNGGDTNLYGYVLQDPVNFIDPSGKAAAFVPIVIIGGIITYIGGNQLINYLYPPPPPGSSPSNPLDIPHDPPNQCPVPRGPRSPQGPPGLDPSNPLFPIRGFPGAPPEGIGSGPRRTG